MLYIYKGDNRQTLRNKLDRLLNALINKSADAEIVRITEDEIDNVDIVNLLATQGLFKENFIILFDNVHKYLANNKQLLQKMDKAEHICIIYADRELENFDRSFDKYAKQVISCNNQQMQKKVINNFAIANAVKSGNRVKAWYELNQLRELEQAPEAVLGIIFWAVKDMLTKRQTSKFNEVKLKKLLIKLAELPHKARIDAINLFDILELFILKEL